MYEAYYSYPVNDGMTISTYLRQEEQQQELQIKLESWLKHHSASKLI